MTEEKDGLAKVLGFTIGALAGYMLITVIQALLIGLILKYMVGIAIGYYQVLGCIFVWDLIKPRIQFGK